MCAPVSVYVCVCSLLFLLFVVVVVDVHVRCLWLRLYWERKLPSGAFWCTFCPPPPHTLLLPGFAVVARSASATSEHPLVAIAWTLCQCVVRYWDAFSPLSPPPTLHSLFTALGSPFLSELVQTCEKVLDCGHACPKPCHNGNCPPCSVTVLRDCRYALTNWVSLLLESPSM
jgi:hypothetical protein